MSEPVSTRDQAVLRFRLAFDLAGLAPADLDLALTHRSHAFESDLSADNERLEFLGDAVLGMIVSEYLYTHDVEADEGTLSKRRARLVSRAALGELAQTMGLGEIMLLGRGERDSGGARRSSVLGSALEALVGMIYLRQGFAVARDFVSRHLLPALLETREGGAAGEIDYKSALQEWTQHAWHLLPVYRRLGEEGPAHERVFRVEVVVDERVLAEASGTRVKHAENEAARLALDRLRREATES